MKKLSIAALLPILAVCCAKAPIIAEGPEPERRDTITVIVLNSDCETSHTDIFIYDCSPLRKLEYHKRTYGIRDTVRLAKGDHILAAISNCPGKFNPDALSRFEAMENLSFLYSNDSPYQPVLSGMTVFEAGSDINLRLDPLLCRIDFLGIESESELEDVRIWLENANAEAEIMRWSNFHVKGLLNNYRLDPESVYAMRYPGMIFQNIETPADWRFRRFGTCSLYCYPNDADDGIGTIHTEVVLQAGLGGDIKEFRQTLQSPRRGGNIQLELSVDASGDGKFCLLGD